MFIYLSRAIRYVKQRFNDVTRAKLEESKKSPDDTVHGYPQVGTGQPQAC